MRSQQQTTSVLKPHDFQFDKWNNEQRQSKKSNTQENCFQICHQWERLQTYDIYKKPIERYSSLFPIIYFYVNPPEINESDTNRNSITSNKRSKKLRRLEVRTHDARTQPGHGERSKPYNRLGGQLLYSPRKFTPSFHIST